jgi:hypothetical protein
MIGSANQNDGIATGSSVHSMATCGCDRFPDKAELVKLDWSNRKVIP